MFAMLFPTTALAHEPEDVLSVQRQSGSHRYTVRLVTGQFRPHGRHLQWVRLKPHKDEFLPGYRVGSKFCVFGYGYEPVGYSRAEILHRSVLKELERHTEIRSLIATVDGQPWVVRPRLIRDLLDPHTLKDQLLTTLSPDGKTLWMRNKGSLHGAAYWVMWILHADGRQNRVDDDGPRYLGN